MKQLIFIAGIAIAGLIYSCGKGGGPQPTDKPVMPTKPVETTPVDTIPTQPTGGTGMTPVNPPTPTDDIPVFNFVFARTTQFVLDPAHDQITQLGFEISGKEIMKFSTSGNIRIRIKNIDQKNVTYENADYNERLYMGNAIQLNEKSTTTLKDTSTKACWFITDPALKDAATGKQIIQVLFLHNDLSAGSGAIGFQSATKFKKDEISAEQAIAKFTRNDLKLL